MFRDRTEAGNRLAEALAGLDLPNPVVLALPRGGVPVALPVAKALHAPLDLLLVRKIGTPMNPELAAGALVEGAAPVFNHTILAGLGLTEESLAPVVAQKRAEIAARRAAWLAGRPPVPREGATLVLVDDGIATGATVRAALTALAGAGAAALVLAVPVAPADTLDALAPLCDRVICLETPLHFYAVGAHYTDFGQVADDEVAALIKTKGSAS